MVTINLDPDALTLQDCEDIEEYCGVSIGSILGPGGIPAKALTALAWIVMRRDDKDLTMDAVRELTIGEIDIKNVESEENPTVAAG